MNNQEAKFFLRARRPDGRDAADPLFAEALAQAARDPSLAAWLDREQSFDAAIASKLRTVQPPADWRATVLAGVHASRRRRSWWRQSGLAALAASVVLAAGITFFSKNSRPEFAEFTRVAMSDSSDMSAHGRHGPGVGALQIRLSQPATRLLAGAGLDLATLKAAGCRSLRVGGRDVFEVCFERKGLGEFHLYVAARNDVTRNPGDENAVFVEKGRLASASWSDARHVYSLVTDAGTTALRQIL